MPTELEDDFIRHARRSKHKRTGLILLALSASYKQTDAFAAAGLVLPAQGGPGMSAHSATPRGLDLLASANAAGYDPDARKAEPTPAPATRECPACKGEGRVPLNGLGGPDRSLKELLEGPDGRCSAEAERDEPVLLPGWDATCPTCQGAKVVPAVATRSIDAWLTPRFVIGVDPAHEGSEYTIAIRGSRSPDGHLRIHDEIRIDRTQAKVSDFADLSAYDLRYCETERTSSKAKTQPGEWIGFTCLADVEGWESAAIEVRHRDGRPVTSPRKVTNFSSGLGCFGGDILHTTVGALTAGLGWQFRKLKAVTQGPTGSRWTFEAGCGWRIRKALDDAS